MERQGTEKTQRHQPYPFRRPAVELSESNRFQSTEQHEATSLRHYSIFSNCLKFYKLRKTRNNASTDRAVLRSLRPGHIYVEYSDNKARLACMASQAYQFNSREGKTANLYYHKRITVLVLSGKEVFCLELFIFTFKDHEAGRDKDWNKKQYGHAS